MNIAMFMSLVWVLFGSQCDYYKSLCQIIETLELKEVYVLKASFTAKNCHRITWAILDDGRAFFNNVKTTIDFTGPDMTFPQTYLIDILNNVRYAVPVKRASFPNECQRRERAKDDKNQAKTPEGQGGREHASEQSLLPRGAYGNGAGGSSKPNPYGQIFLEAQVRGATSTASMPTWNPSPRGEGGANGTGEQDGTTFITTRSRLLWTHTWNGTMEESTWPRCLMRWESGKRIYRHYRISAMQTANHLCAGTACWDSACITNVATYGKAAILGPTTSRTTSPRKYVQSSAGGSKHVCSQGAGMGHPGRSSKQNQSLKPDKQHNTRSTVGAMRVGNNLDNMG